MDNETTRLINDPAAPKQAPESTKTSKANKSGKGAAAAGGFVAGAALGIGGSAFAADSQAHSDQLEEANKTDEANDATNTSAEIAPTPEQVLLANDEGMRVAHVDANNFNDAFAQARAQVGPGGVFEYNGRLYGTYLADEWNNMSAQEQVDYQSRVNEVATSHHSTSPYNEAASNHPTYDHQAVHPANTEQPGHTQQTATIHAEPAESEIKVLGVESVQNGNGQIMNIALVEAAGDQALMIDVDNNGSIDVLLHDDDGNGQISDSEAYDVSQAGIDIRDLAEIHMMQNPDLYQASADPEPDPMSGFDSYAEV